jgi:HPt (histidine-containing phosphotransfer) domain-containing protein
VIPGNAGAPALHLDARPDLKRFSARIADAAVRGAELWRDCFHHPGRSLRPQSRGNAADGSWSGASVTKKPSASSAHSGGAGGLLSGQLAALREQFRNRLQSDRDALAREHAGAVRGPPNREALQRVLRLAHGLHGVAASFGYGTLSGSAARVETGARLLLEGDPCAYQEKLGALVESLITDLGVAVADG